MFGYQARLHPGIAYSHPASKTCCPPELTVHRVTTTRHASHLGTGSYSHYTTSPSETLSWCQFSLVQSSLDWSYPVDLCGGCYRLHDITDMIQTYVSSGRVFGNPNIFEVEMNKLFWQNLWLHKYHSNICPTALSLKVITVNRVQTQYTVPIYHHDLGSVDALNGFLGSQRGSEAMESGEMVEKEEEEDGGSQEDRTKQLSSERYRNDVLCLTSHVGDLFFSADDKRPFTTSSLLATTPTLYEVVWGHMHTYLEMWSAH